MRVVVCIRNQLLLVTMWHSVMWVEDSLFSHSPVQGHWAQGRLWVWGIMNKAARNIHIQVFVWTGCFDFSPEIHRSGISGPYGKDMFF